MIYTFQGVAGDFVEVEASTEGAARREAMQKKWGDPKPLIFAEPGSTKHLVIGEPIWHGDGLLLVSTKK
jgi:hypothetical protein